MRKVRFRAASQELGVVCILSYESFFHKQAKSLANKLKRRGPRPEPWKTLMLFGSLDETFVVPEWSVRLTLWV